MLVEYPNSPPQAEIDALVASALAEDIGAGDLTASLIDPEQQDGASVMCRESAVLCGVAWFESAFRQCDSGTIIDWHHGDGDTLEPNTIVCTINGKARALVTAERTALNFLQTLSATATQTNRHVDQLKGTSTRLLDTRKTIPLLRRAQKYAVVCGGGVNHRIGLFDGILIKENHILAAGSIKDAVAEMQAQYPEMEVEVEVENLDQLREAIDARADIALLDNFDLDTTHAAVALAKGKIKTEASGGFEFDDIAVVAKAGVDFISVGGLTKNVQAVDFSMRFNPR